MRFLIDSRPLRRGSSDVNRRKHGQRSSETSARLALRQSSRNTSENSAWLPFGEDWLVQPRLLKHVFSLNWQCYARIKVSRDPGPRLFMGHPFRKCRGPGLIDRFRPLPILSPSPVVLSMFDTIPSYFSRRPTCAATPSAMRWEVGVKSSLPKSEPPD
ncbi:hypothetical protein BX600DRAFT_138893 [Xylariales sp. PMI_506]|nr:hypothetical protein BX600DRAFT_138893 [Xylariales sp. PMI_506]